MTVGSEGVWKSKVMTRMHMRCPSDSLTLYYASEWDLRSIITYPEGIIFWAVSQQGVIICTLSKRYTIIIVDDIVTLM